MFVSTALVKHAAVPKSRPFAIRNEGRIPFQHGRRWEPEEEEEESRSGEVRWLPAEIHDRGAVDPLPVIRNDPSVGLNRFS